MKLTKLLLVFILITSYTSVQAQKVTNVTFKSDQLLTNEGLYFTKFQFNARITPHGDCIDVINGYVFVTWYKGGMTKRNLMLSRKKIDGGEWKTIEFPDRLIGYQGIATNGDSHNTAAIAVCPIDSTIHLLYDMHAYSKANFPDNYFNYRVTKKGKAFVEDKDWNISLFYDKQHYLLAGVNYEGSTYPGFNRFDNGNIMADIRFGGSGNGRDQYAIYDGKTWSANVQFNNGSQPAIKDKYSIYGSYQYANGKLYNGFSIRYSLANTDDAFKYVYNNGLFFAYATAPYSTSNWKDINDKTISIPIQNPDVVKVAEPCEIGIGNDISISPLFTVTVQGDIHYMTTVSGTPVHYYKKAGMKDFTWSTECPPTAGQMFSIGNTVLLVVLEDERPVFKITNGGENNWTTLLKVNTGDRYRHCNVVKEGNNIFIYAMKVGSGDAQPITLLTYEMTFEQDPVIDNAISFVKPTVGAQFSAGINLLVEASAGSAITSVDLFRNDTLVRTITGAPYVWGLDTLVDVGLKKMKVGSYNLKLVANNAIGEKTEAHTSFTVLPLNVQLPFSGSPIAIPGKIELEDYDTGGEGLAYHDTDNINQNGVYRSDGVDVATGGSKYVIGSTNLGEWMEYTIDVADAGKYDIDLYYSSGKVGGGAAIGVELKEEGIVLVPSFLLPKTANWDTYDTINVGSVLLSKGQHVLRVNVVVNGFNSDWMQFKRNINSATNQVRVDVSKIHPNPSANGLYYMSQPIKWAVFSVLGSKVVEGEGDKIDISSFNKGTYILKTNLKSRVLIYQ